MQTVGIQGYRYNEDIITIVDTVGNNVHESNLEVNAYHSLGFLIRYPVPIPNPNYCYDSQLLVCFSFCYPHSAWYSAVSGATTLTGSAVVDGTGQIVLDNLFCTGTESRLVNCPNNGLGVHNCVHSEDAGVRCLPPVSSKL